jgi:hypothetical protein
MTTLNETRNRLTAAIVVGLGLLGIVAALVFAPDQPTAAANPVGLIPVPASVTYRQNVHPDYVNFAFAYGGLVGAPDYAITSNMGLARDAGDTLCSQLRAGVSESEMVTRITGSGSGQFTLTASDARGVVDSAHLLICSGK